MAKTIRIKGARVHNLKNISLEIPRDKLVVMTGLSGSGKSSLAFDTIYAEGQRRYVESLSAYARQFLGLMDKPDVDQIDGLSPAISIDQKTTTHNPRSTVGTVTEIYDYLRLLYARTGTPHCPVSGAEITSQTPEQIVDRIKEFVDGTKILIMAPIVRDQKGEHRGIIGKLVKQGYGRIRVDGHIYPADEAEKLELEKQKKHTIDAVIDRITVSKDTDYVRVVGSVESALRLGDGFLTVLDTQEDKEYSYSEQLVSPVTGLAFPPLEPRLFSFNSPHGACAECAGLGSKLEVDPDLIIPNKRLSVSQGAIKPWARLLYGTWTYRQLEQTAEKHGFDLNTPVSDLREEHLNIILRGSPDGSYEGVIKNIERRYEETDSDHVRKDFEQYMRKFVCPACEGTRLRAEALAVTIHGKNISEISELCIADAISFFKEYQSHLNKHLSAQSLERKVSTPILKEVSQRLGFLLDVGLSYLTLSRGAATLSGGESQRIRLATQIGSSLTGVIYILDEPSIGLHQRDNDRLIETLKKLRDIGNTVIVVEHDEDTIKAADYIVDIGPGAGEHGGKIVFSGTIAQLKKNKKSVTAKYVIGSEKMFTPKKLHEGNGNEIVIVNAAENNLKNITVSFPLGKLVSVTGVSGSGKSSLMIKILAAALSKHFYRSNVVPGKHEEIKGLENVDKVINIDQSPIGRTPRSNPATYTGIFDPVRDLFASMPESKVRGYGPGRFSFNVKGGRCESCQGEGLIKVEMNFLPDVYVECEECHGKRYNRQTLEVQYRGKTVSDILDMTVDEALMFFDSISVIKNKLQTLVDVGLGYVRLGQPATTLSGGEAQRIKLATELTRRSTGKTIYILDEPTTGLHFADVNKLLHVLHRLVDKGNSVFVIEHNLDVIRASDWVIDIGPEGGSSGGEVVAEGTPEEIAKVKKSHTGLFLAKRK